MQKYLLRKIKLCREVTSNNLIDGTQIIQLKIDNDREVSTKFHGKRDIAGHNIFLKSLSTRSDEFSLYFRMFSVCIFHSHSSRATKFTLEFFLLDSSTAILFHPSRFSSLCYLFWTSGRIIYAGRFVLPSSSGDESGWGIAFISFVCFRRITRKRRVCRLLFSFLPSFLLPPAQRKMCSVNCNSYRNDWNEISKPLTTLAPPIALLYRNNEIVYLSSDFPGKSHRERKCIRKYIARLFFLLPRHCDFAKCIVCTCTLYINLLL